jgi:hypothetical protein
MADWLGSDLWNVKTHVIVSAASGGVVAAVVRRGTFMQRFVSGFTGAVLSTFLTPLIAPVAERLMEWGVKGITSAHFDILSDSVTGATGFIVGTIGFELTRLMLNTSKAGADRLPDAIIDRAEDMVEKK